jgi:hypothetical protein
MKSIIFIITLLLGNQAAFGMNIKNTPNHPEINTVQYLKFHNSKSYVATLKNSDVVYTYFFTKGPNKGSISCERSTFNKGQIDKISIDNNAYHELRNLYKAQNH